MLKRDKATGTTVVIKPRSTVVSSYMTVVPIPEQATYTHSVLK
jgi:hypothetical protein